MQYVKRAVHAWKLWHCSEPNLSGSPRRAYYAQYSRDAIGGEDAPTSLAIRTRPEQAQLLPATATMALAGLPAAAGGEAAGGGGGSTQYETETDEASVQG